MENLDEDVFTLDKKGIEEMDKFLKDDDDPFKKLTVIDTEAPDDESLKDSYEGKVIITCPVCHADVFADPASLEIDQDGVTTHTECPYCHTTDEFEIKGQVVPFGGEVEEETKDSEEGTEDDGSVEETEEETEVKEESLKESVDKKKKLNEEPRYDLRPEYDSRQSFHSKAYVDDEGSEKTLYSYHTKVAEIKDGKPILYPKWDFSSTTLRHVKEFLKQNGFKAETQKQIARDYAVENESLKEDKQAAKVVDKYQEWVDYDMKKYGKISGITKKKLAKAGFEVVKDDHGDYEVIAKDLKESIDIHVDRENEDVSVKTDGIVVDATDKEVHVHDDTEEEETQEVVEPITKETEDKILKANDMADEDDYVEEEPVEGEEEEVEFSEFEESYFNKLGTTYLRENYGNVRNFETTSAKESNGKFVVEGVINFRSGTTKKTSFVFEGKTISKTGRMKMLGENKEIGTGRNAFVLRAKYDNGKVMCESLTYNYNTKDGNNQVNVCGKAKISK